ncbi:putative transposase [Vigna unguiculata]|uniref:Putative transposase n=1 Tax=Vigna unguiculata TaxID=3917 RepID=A0A4D6LYH1_VIGUN|nr:putative transposase [Vigna unguiculata]
MVKEIYDLPLGDKVVIPFDGNQPSATNVDGLLGGFLGRLAAYSKMFSICFENWHLVLNSYKNRAWNDVIKAKLLWDPIYETAAKVYMMKDIGKKWKENMLKLFCTYYDDKKSRDENVKNPPLSIPETEWATFIDYRLKENTKNMCKRNVENRSKLKINHTGGSKKLKRKRAEIVSI